MKPDSLDNPNRGLITCSVCGKAGWPGGTHVNPGIHNVVSVTELGQQLNKLVEKVKMDTLYRFPNCGCLYDTMVNEFTIICSDHERGIENRVAQYRTDIEYNLYVSVRYRGGK